MAVIQTSKVNLDKVGACASAICAVHCLLTGVALGLLSVAGLGFFGSIWTDIAFMSFAVFIGSFAVIHGHKHHHSYVPGMIFSLGIVFIILGHFVFRHSHEVVHANENPWVHNASTFFSVLGGLSLVGFHLVNLRLQKHCSQGCDACLNTRHPAA